MVARLVQQHHVGPHQEDARQRHPHFPAARQRADVTVHHLLAEAEARQRFACTPIQRIAIELFEAMLHLAIAGDDGLHVVREFRVGHRGFELFQFGRDHADGAGAIHHFGDCAAA